MNLPTSRSHAYPFSTHTKPRLYHVAYITKLLYSFKCKCYIHGSLCQWYSGNHCVFGDLPQALIASTHDIIQCYYLVRCGGLEQNAYVMYIMFT